jgi:hypothetical protein
VCCLTLAGNVKTERLLLPVNRTITVVTVRPTADPHPANGFGPKAVFTGIKAAAPVFSDRGFPSNADVFSRNASA